MFLAIVLVNKKNVIAKIIVLKPSSSRLLLIGFIFGVVYCRAFHGAILPIVLLVVVVVVKYSSSS